MPQPSERITKFNLLGGEDTYASQTAQNPQTARRLLSLIPSFAGYLEREKAHPRFSVVPTNTPAASLGAPIGWTFQADFADPATGTNHRYFLAATETSLAQLISGSTDSWQTIPAPGDSIVNIVNYPQAVLLNNKLLLSDGTTSWTIVPTADFSKLIAVSEGFDIPLHKPASTLKTPTSYTAVSSPATTIHRVNGITTITLGISSFFSVAFQGVWYIPEITEAWVTIGNVTADTSFQGSFPVNIVNANTFNFSQLGLPDSSPSATGATFVLSVIPSILSTRYYWSTFEDDGGAILELGFLPGVSRSHESSSTPRSDGTGAVTNQLSVITNRIGTYAPASPGSFNVVGTGTDWSQDDVGKVFYCRYNGITPSGGGIILSVADAQHMALSAPVSLLSSGVPGYFNIAPIRATKWNIYASESESSNIGFLLSSNPLTQLAALDQTPFAGDSAGISLFDGNETQRPYRQDPPVPSLISTVFSNRNFHRRETKPNFFVFSGYEEVLQFGTFADPAESYPGTDPNTTSDYVNETSYPDQSRQIRNIVAHGDALFLFSEKNTYALYGQSIDDFSLTQTTAFTMGCAGRYASVTTPHGLVFVSFDGKVMLYPTQFVFWAILGDATSALIEISRPKRTTFEQIDLTSPDNVQVCYYQYGRRNWLVLTYKQLVTGAYLTWVYDFETQGWFQLAQGVVCAAVFEPTDGYKVLVGGGPDGNLYVLDDVTGHYTSSSAQPQGTYRPALIDFGRPDMNHVIHYAEFEVSNPAMNVSVNYYLDPLDVDNPGTPRSFNVTATRVGAGKFRCFPKQTGNLCNRVLMEFLVASDTNDGQVRSISLYAELAAAVVG